MAFARCTLIVISSLFLLCGGIVRGADTKLPRTDMYGDPLPPGAVMRLGTIRLRHAAADVAFSKDGKQLISCGTDGEVRVWDVVTGVILRRRRLAWKPDDLELRVRDVALSSDGETAAVWDHRTLFLFDTATGKERNRLSTRPNSPCPRLRISPDGKIVAVEDFDYLKARTLSRLWDTAGGVIHHLSLDPASHGLSCLAFAPDGKRLAGIGFTGNRLYLWNALTGEEIRKAKDGVVVQGESVTFSPHGETLAVSALSDPIVYLLDAATWKEKGVLHAPGKIRGSIGGLVFSANGRSLAGVYGDALGDSTQQGVLLWGVAGDKKALRLPQRSNSRLRFSPDNKTLACHSATEISLWNVTTGQQLQPRTGHDWRVETLVVSPDGRILASCAVDRILRLWDLVSGKPLQQLDAGGTVTKHCSFSPDGKHIITACNYSREGTILQTRDIAARKELWRFTIPRQESIDALGISADGKRTFATVVVPERDVEENIANSMRLRAWNADTGKLLSQRSYRMEVRTIPVEGLGGDVRKAYRDHTVFAPDGVTMSVWQGIEDISSGCLRASLPKEIVHPMVFSADGRLLVAAITQSHDFGKLKGLALFEAASGDELFCWNIGTITYAAFTSDSRGVIVADEEKLRVWDTVTGIRLFQIQWPENIRDARGKSKICSLASLPAGRVATGMVEGDILVWDLAASTWPVRRVIAEFGRRELDALWSDLAGDARKAQHAIAPLAALPEQVVPFLRERLQPTVEVDTKRIDQWLVDLDSATFTTREAANRELAGLCDRIESRLRRALRDRPSLEMRRRLEDILAKPRRNSAARLRTIRAIAVLEHIGTPDARRLLEKLAGGAAAPETRAAHAALQRLNHRDAWTSGKPRP